MNRLAFVILFFTKTTLAQVSPPGGAVTLQPGAGTVQPSTPSASGNVPSASGNGLASPVIDLPVSGVSRFGDATLTNLVQLGLSNSPNLRAAVSRIEEARGRVRIAQSFLQPSVRDDAKPVGTPARGDSAGDGPVATFSTQHVPTIAD